MATTNFVDQQTIVEADWLNDVDALVYEGKFPATIANVEVNTISEKTAASGVTIDSLLIKDGAIPSLALNSGASLVGYTQGGTGDVDRTVQARLRDYVTVKDFGAVGNGSTDDTSAIQAAITAMQTAGGGAVYFPPGNYKITTKLSVTHSGIHLIGSGIESTILTFDNGTNDCIEAYGTDTSSNQLNGFSIRDMSIKHGTKTAGRTFVISFAYKVYLENLYIENCWTGLEAYVTNNCDLRNINFQGVLGGGNAPTYLGPANQAPLNCYGVFWHAPSDGSYRSDALRLFNVTVQASFSGADGLLWDGGATTLDAYQFTALSCDYGIRIRNTGLSNANYPQFGEFHNVNTDGAKSIGCYIEGGAIFHFNSCNISNTSGITDQGGADTNALKILPDESGSFTRALQFVNCNFSNCREDVVSASARDIQFTGCSFHDGGKAAANTYSGLVLGADAEDVLVTGCRFSQYGSNNNFKYGISVLAGSVRIVLDGNFIYNAQTKAINWLNTDSNSRAQQNNYTNYLRGESFFIVPRSDSLASGGITASTEDLLGGVYTLSGSTGATNVTTDTAANIVAGFDNPSVGKAHPLMLISANSHVVTLLKGSGVSFSGNLNGGGNFEIPVSSTRNFWIRIDNLSSGTEAVTIYG